MAGLKAIALAGEAHRPFKVLYATAYDRTTRPSFVVDISAEFAQRNRAIRGYASQFRPKVRAQKSEAAARLDRLVQYVELTSRFYGEMAGVQYAEPFLVKEVMQADDVVDMPVQSI